MLARGEDVVRKDWMTKKSSVAKASCTPLHAQGKGRAEEYDILGLWWFAQYKAQARGSRSTYTVSGDKIG
jgi:hypothetical protein